MKDNIVSVKELEDIREKAEAMARAPHMHPLWKRGYQRLADAADYLSLLNLRSTILDADTDKEKT